jgi:hypothetical protein
MKSPRTVSDWSKKQVEKNKRVKLFGYSLMLLALTLFALAYFSQYEFVASYLATSEEQQEGYYMMGLVFSVMAIFCTNSGRSHRN